MKDQNFIERRATPDLTSLIADAVARRLAPMLRADQPKLRARYLTYETAGELMDMPVETVRTLVKQGRLPASRDRGITRIAMEDVDAYMKRHRI